MLAKSSHLSTTLGVVEAAKRLGVDLFELSRLIAIDPARLEDGRIEQSSLVDFGERHRIEDWWTSVEDRNTLPKEKVVRRALGMLLERGVIDGQRTRRDNLWRRLKMSSRVAIQECVEVLLDEGLLLARGRHDISVASAGIGTIHIIASGVFSPPALVELWGS